MFTELHALARRATLMIVVAPEGTDQLRVSVTPMKNDGKDSAPELRPLSVVATPAELDAEFAEALAIWQAPRRSVLEQARDAATDDENPATTGGAKKAEPSKKPAPAKKAGAPAAPSAKTGTSKAAPATAADRSTDSGTGSAPASGTEQSPEEASGTPSAADAASKQAAEPANVQQAADDAASTETGGEQAAQNVSDAQSNGAPALVHADERILPDAAGNQALMAGQPCPDDAGDQTPEPAGAPRADVPPPTGGSPAAPGEDDTFTMELF